MSLTGMVYRPPYEANSLLLQDTYYYGSYPSNLVPMQGRLPKHKQDMIEAVQEMRKHLRQHLDEYPVRSGEGSVLRR